MAETQFLNACRLLSDLVDSPLYGKDGGVSRIAAKLSRDLMVLADTSTDDLKIKVRKALETSQDPWAKRLLISYAIADPISNLDPNALMGESEQLEKLVHEGREIDRNLANKWDRLVTLFILASAFENPAYHSLVRDLLVPIEDELTVLSGPKWRPLRNIVMGSNDIASFARQMGIDEEGLVPAISKMRGELQEQGVVFVPSKRGLRSSLEKARDPKPPEKAAEPSAEANAVNPVAASFDSGVQYAMKEFGSGEFGEWLKSLGEDSPPLESIKSYLSDPLKERYIQLVSSGSMPYDSEVAQGLGAASFTWSAIKRLVAMLPEGERQDAVKILPQMQTYMDQNFPEWRKLQFAKSVLSSEAEAEEEDAVMESLPEEYQGGFSNVMKKIKLPPGIQWGDVVGWMKEFHDQYASLPKSAGTKLPPKVAAPAEAAAKEQAVAESMATLLLYLPQVSAMSDDDQKMAWKAIDRAVDTLNRYAPGWEKTKVGAVSAQKLQELRPSASPEANGSSKEPGSIDKALNIAFETAFNDGVTWARKYKEYDGLLQHVVSLGLHPQDTSFIKKNAQGMMKEIMAILASTPEFSVSGPGVQEALTDLARGLIAYSFVLANKWQSIPQTKQEALAALAAVGVDLDSGILGERWKGLQSLKAMAEGRGYSPEAAAEVFKELYPAIKSRIKSALSKINSQGSYAALKSGIDSDILVDPISIGRMFGNIGMGEHMEANRILDVFHQAHASPSTKAQMIIQDLAVWGGQFEDAGGLAGYRLPPGHYLRQHEPPTVPMDLGGSTPNPEEKAPGSATEEPMTAPSFTEENQVWLNPSVYKIVSLVLRKLLAMSQRKSSYWD